jgi:hypothetical protein
MAMNKPPTRRMTLLELLVHTEKYCHDLREHFRVSIWPALTEYRDLCRPVRKRSHFPTMIAVQNGLNKLLDTNNDVGQMVGYFEEWLDEILDQARREQRRRGLG